MKPLLVTHLVPETHVIILKHSRLPKRVRLILATRLHPARLSLPTEEGMVGEAGTQIETQHATSLLVHAETINAQPRRCRRQPFFLVASFFVCTKEEVHYPAMQNARMHVRWEIFRSAQNDRACGRGGWHIAPALATRRIRARSMFRPCPRHVAAKSGTRRAYPLAISRSEAVRLQVADNGAVHHVGIRLRGAHAAVPQQLLHRGDVYALIY